MSNEKVEKEEFVPETSEELPKGSEGEVQNTVDPDWSEDELAKATADGYYPENEKGLSPGEYNRNGSFIKRIEKQNRAIKSLKYSIHELKNQMTEAQKRGYEEGLRALEAQRREAVKYGNEADFERLDAQVNQTKAEMASMTPSMDPEQQEFIEQNKDWFYGDSAKGAVIQEKVLDFTKRLPATMSPEEKMKEINEYVALTFPERGGVGSKKETAAKAKPVAAVASGSPALKSSNGGKYTIDDLDENGVIGYNRIRNNNPKFTVDEYVTLLQRGKR